MRDQPKDIDFAFDSSCRSNAMPVSLQRSVESIEERVIAPFFRASLTALRTDSMCW